MVRVNSESVCFVPMASIKQAEPETGYGALSKYKLDTWACSRPAMQKTSDHLSISTILAVICGKFANDDAI